MRSAVIFRLAFICVIFLALPASALGGNKWMMEKGGNELIMLNTLLLQRLGAIQKDGKIILSGDVVHEDGKVKIKLYQLQQIDSAGGEQILAPEVFEKDLPYHIFLREEELSEIPIPAKKEDGKDN